MALVVSWGKANLLTPHEFEATIRQLQLSNIAYTSSLRNTEVQWSLNISGSDGASSRDVSGWGHFPGFHVLLATSRTT